MMKIPSRSVIARGRLHPGELVWWAMAAAAWYFLPDYRSFGTSVLIMVMLTLSYDLLLGFSGILSFGHAVFFGAGAYVAGWLSLAGWSEPITGALIAGGCAATVAAIVGPFILRLTGLPFLMVTLALGVLVHEAGREATALTGGDDGLNGIRFAPIFGTFRWGLGGSTQYLYVFGWLLVVYVALRRVTSSPFGIELQAIRDNPTRMRLSGNSVLPHLTTAFAISAGVAGIAGAMLTQTTAFVSLGVLSIDNSINVLVMLVLGGVGSLYGALVGAPAYMMLQYFTSQLSPFYWMLAVGVVLVVTVLAGQGGILGLLGAAGRKLTGKAAS